MDLSVRRSERLRGIAIGTLILTLFGAAWMVEAVNAQSLAILVAVVLIPTPLLLLRAIGVFRASRAARQDEPPLNADDLLARRAVGRRFSLVFAAETAAIVIAVNVLAHFRQDSLLLPVIGIIVGIHFLPLARLFRYRGYIVTGAAEVVLCAASALALHGHPAVLDPVVGLIMALTLWLTVLAALLHASHLAHHG